MLLAFMLVMGRKLNRGRLFYFYRICTKINLSLVKAIFMKRSSLSFLLKFNFWIEFFWVSIIATSLRQCISVTGDYDFVENDHNDKKIQYRSRSSTRSPDVGPNPKVRNKTKRLKLALKRIKLSVWRPKISVRTAKISVTCLIPRSQKKNIFATRKCRNFILFKTDRKWIFWSKKFAIKRVFFRDSFL